MNIGIPENLLNYLGASAQARVVLHFHLIQASSDSLCCTPVIKPYSGGVIAEVNGLPEHVYLECDGKPLNIGDSVTEESAIRVCGKVPAKVYVAIDTGKTELIVT